MARSIVCYLKFDLFLLYCIHTGNYGVMFLMVWAPTRAGDDALDAALASFFTMLGSISPEHLMVRSIGYIYIYICVREYFRAVKLHWFELSVFSWCSPTPSFAAHILRSSRWCPRTISGTLRVWMQQCSGMSQG